MRYNGWCPNYMKLKVLYETERSVARSMVLIVRRRGRTASRRFNGDNNTKLVGGGLSVSRYHGWVPTQFLRECLNPLG